jgi:crotonobetainyl-CoA:carnitine CoA-transferase CaiB-like acyl-CoA transferase
MSADNKGAFAGLRVVDASQGLAGPGAAMLLGQHGATVIKVEPADGDWSRTRGVNAGDFSTLAIATNSGKRSIALDLKKPAGAAVLEKMVSSADVFLQSFRPGVIDRLGFGYARLSAAYPALIYASVSGFGLTGAQSERPATDAVIQAASGIMSVNLGVSDGMPHRLPIWPIDFVTGLFVFQNIAVALYQRRDTGRGHHVDCSLMQSALSFQSVSILEHAAAGKETALPTSCPNGTFRTTDGWLNLVVSKDEHWIAFCKVIGREDLGANPTYSTVKGRITNHAFINGEVAKCLAAKPSRHWCDAFVKIGLLHDRVSSYDDVLSDGDVKAMNIFEPVPVPGMGTLPIARAPGLPGGFGVNPQGSALPAVGQHTVEVLREYGYAQGEIDGLLASGAVTQK